MRGRGASSPFRCTTTLSLPVEMSKSSYWAMLTSGSTVTLEGAHLYTMSSALYPSEGEKTTSRGGWGRDVYRGEAKQDCRWAKRKGKGCAGGGGGRTVEEEEEEDVEV